MAHHSGNPALSCKGPCFGRALSFLSSVEAGERQSGLFNGETNAFSNASFAAQLPLFRNEIVIDHSEFLAFTCGPCIESRLSHRRFHVKTLCCGDPK
ncbi:hypothetical protein CDAR_402971 [Caerostris darwini]|uniref:Uncharacterized protein n=1 Tax=Caerostris darwini TaxID=1538125 RepID=A0AAV4X0M8_9ARAC|nr:hypothetical protein CDAR_402971 [Caerostris darwini]